MFSSFWLLILAFNFGLQETRVDSRNLGCTDMVNNQDVLWVAGVARISEAEYSDGRGNYSCN